MTTPTFHILGAFVTLIFVNRLLKTGFSEVKLLLISIASLTPDLVDKTLTGTRYPTHSLVVSGILLLVINLAAYYFVKRKDVSMVLLFGSLAILTHPILDLESSVPLFYPIDMAGYEINFNITIIQAIPPVISSFVLELDRVPFDYSRTYDHEGQLLGGLDVLFLSLIIFPTVIFLVRWTIKEIMTKRIVIGDKAK